MSQRLGEHQPGEIRQMIPAICVASMAWDKPRLLVCQKEEHTAWKTWAKISVFHVDPVANAREINEN